MDLTQIQHQRQDYTRATLRAEDLDARPDMQLQRWLDEASQAGIVEPNAMTLATATRTGAPSARIVLLRGLAEEGLRFFTNYESRKGVEARENPHAAVLFFWPLLERQVRVEGMLERLSAEDSERYFHSRPRESQLGAWASKQSAPLADRAVLERELAAYAEKMDGQEIPLPPFWGGYLLRPTRYEFWQGRSSRLHDRLVYEATTAGVFALQRLYP